MPLKWANLHLGDGLATIIGGANEAWAMLLRRRYTGYKHQES